MSHKATPEQWATQQRWAADGGGTHTCILELRDRIAALEAAANSSAGLTGSPAPAGGLVERVAEAIIDGMVSSDQEAARAAIREIAEWLEQQSVGAALVAARWLREEVDR